MNAPLTPDEILELLPRLAATDKKTAIYFGSKIPGAKFEYYDGQPICEWREHEMVWRVLDHCASVRVTIPRPPKRRALRRDELEEKIRCYSDESIEEFRNRGFERLNGYKLYSEEVEPQEPLVISTEKS